MARYTEPVFPVKKLVPLTADLAERIRDYRFQQRIESENEAIRRLIEAGLRSSDPVPVRNDKPSGGEGTEPSGSSKPASTDSAASEPPKATAPKPRSAPATSSQPLTKTQQLRALREQGAR